MSITASLWRLVPLAAVGVFAAAACGDPPCEDTLTCDVGPTGGSSPTSSSGDGGGRGTLALGEACEDGGECQSGSCADGVCCDAACDGACVACSTAGACEPHAEGTDPDGDCAGAVCDGGGMCGAPPLVWTRQFGDVGRDRVYDMAATPDGGLVVVGSFSGSVNFGGGVATSLAGGDAFVVKLDTDGNHVWSRTFGDPTPPDATLQTEAALAVAVAADGSIWVAGEVQGDSVGFGGPAVPSVFGDAFLMELDSAGSNQSVRVFTGSETSGLPDSRRIEALAIDDAGGLVLGGSARGGLTIDGVPMGGPGNAADGFLVRLDAGLNHVYSDFIDDNGVVSSVAVAPDGDVVVCGQFFVPITIGGQAIAPGGTQDGFIARLTTTGQAEWVKTLGAGGSACRSVAVGTDGSVVAGGSFTGTVDLGAGQVLTGGATESGFLVKYAASGVALWAEQVGGASGGRVQAVTVGAGDFVTLWGWFEGSGSFAGQALESSGLQDFLLARLGPSGDVAFVKTLGGSNAEDSPRAIQATTRSVIVSGDFSNTLALDAETLVPNGSSDVFVAKFGVSQ